MLEHQGERKKVNCPHCNKELVEQYRNWHIKNIHTDGNSLQFKCKLCARTFKQKRNCIAHEKRHDMENFKCKVCDKEFKWKATYKRHLVRSDHKSTIEYDENGTFGCEKCKKCFSTRELLIAHDNNDHKVTKMACHECGKEYYSFMQEQLLHSRL